MYNRTTNGLIPRGEIEIAVPYKSETTETRTASEYVAVLARRKWFILSMAVLGALGGMIYFLFQPAVYYASTTLELQGINESFMNMSAVDPQAGTGNYSVTQLNIQTQLKIIESGAIRGPVADRLKREITPVTTPRTDFFGRLRFKLGIDNQDPLESSMQALGQAIRSARARNVPGTRIISVGCQSTNPDIAASVVNAMAAEYISQNAQSRLSSTQRTSQWLESQVDEAKAKLEQAEAKLQEFVRSAGLEFVSDPETLANSKLKALQMQLADLQSDRIAKQSKYEMAKSSPPNALPDVLDDAALRDYQKKLADLRRELANLLTVFTPANPKVTAVQAQVDALEIAFTKEREAVIRRIQNDYESALRRERLLSGAYISQSQAVASQGDKAAQYSLLKREVETVQHTLNVMLQQTNQAGVVAAVPANHVRVIDPAEPNTYTRSFPLQEAATGSVLGFLGGYSLVLVLEKTRRRKREQRFETPGRATGVFQVPELGIIPSANYEPGVAKRRWLRKPAIPFAKPSEANGLSLAISQRTNSLVADSFRLVLASITLLARQGKRPGVIVVTSPGAGEGKTTVTSNLGIAMAEIGRRVLLVDCDVRRPKLHEVFNTDERGYSDAVLGSDDLRENLHTLIHRTNVPGLFVMAAGTTQPEVTDQLAYSPRLPLLLKIVREEFDFVLIDTPPMLQFSEARLLGGLSDGIIMVIRSGVTDHASAVSCREQLRVDCIPLLGTVLNDWVPDAHDSAQYSRQYRAYSQDPAGL